ncbi:MAG: anthranilate synthase component I family protein [Chitinophagaceae bacterium]
MKYTTQTFAIDDIAIFKQQMLNWSNQFNICCFLDNCNSQDNYHTYEFMLAVDVFSDIKITQNNNNWKQELNAYLTTNALACFGHISYNFKSVIVNDKHQPQQEFPLLYFFQPKILIKYKNGALEINTAEVSPNTIFSSIKSTTATLLNHNNKKTKTAVDSIKPTQTKEAYLTAIENLKLEIVKGNCYEINYCTEFISNNIHINPIEVYLKLTTLSPTPFASFYKHHHHYCITASPERFLKREGKTIIAQPIKGTIKANPLSLAANEVLKQTLLHSKKDKAENVMVVDLVRNDLSKVCIPGSVYVDELFGIYSFKQVHQMISTVVGTLNNTATFGDIIESTFPMGSMTGAPKHKVMQLIDEYEIMNRDIYSGCIGYINNNGDFDFNVVIRSIFYDAHLNKLSYKVGSGITHYSNAEEEYEECLLKATAIEQVLMSNS